MPEINRADIVKGIAAPRVLKVDTPEWGDAGYVYVRELRASEAGSIERLSQNGKSTDTGQALAAWCVLGICDKAGKRTFTDEDVDVLLQAPLSVLQRCAVAVMEFNGLTEEGESARKKSIGRSVSSVRVRPRKRTRPRRR